MKNLTATIKNVFFASLVSLVAFGASAATGVEVVSDNYLYESLIQTEFEIDAQTENSIVRSTTNLEEVVLEMAKADTQSEVTVAE